MDLGLYVKFALSVDHYIFWLEIIKSPLSAVNNLEDANKFIDDVNGFHYFDGSSELVEVAHVLFQVHLVLGH